MKDPMEVMDELAKEGLPYWDYQLPKQKKKYNKYMVYALLGIAFLASMFFIFKPSDSSTTSSEVALPEPSEVILPKQKEKVYQMEAWFKKQRDARAGFEKSAEQSIAEQQPKDPTASNEGDFMQ